MTTFQGVLGWLERASDWISPIVVKEVRQLARGREFHFSFSGSLLVGLAIASLGAADAISGNGTSGGWTFAALMGCLALLGLAVVPLGAFSALRNERLEQTLDLITLTALSPRRVVIGKLMTQGVKLSTLFAGLAPFVAMSFLLGGIDFVTILLSMAMLFMWSLWACAACLFLSALPKTRAMSGLMFGVLGVVVLLGLIVFGGPRVLYFIFSGGGFGGPFGVGMGGGGSTPWWVLALITSACVMTTMNLVLLAENRLSLPSENRVTPLRVGFLAQFLLTAAWTLSFIKEPSSTRFAAIEVFGVLAGLQLAIVAIFTLTEDLVLSRRVLLGMQGRPAWRRLLFAMFLPGGGRGAVYVLTQMGLLLGAAWLLQPTWEIWYWLQAICGYILFFTGVPIAAFRLMRPSQAVSFQLRVAVLVLIPIVMLLPDIFFYMLQPADFDMTFSARHLLDPFRTLGNWRTVDQQYGFTVPFAVGLIGLLAYVLLIRVGMRMTAQSVTSDSYGPAAVAGAPHSAKVVD
jgi:hypothetical protein